MSALVPTLRDFQPILALVDAGLIKATFKFSDLRAVLTGFGALTPDVDAALKQIEANPTLIDVGIQQFKDAIGKYPLDTPLSDIFGAGSTGGGGATTTFTPAQIASGSAALFQVLQNVQKAGDQFLTTPSGQKIANELYSTGQALTKLVTDYNAKTLTTLQFNDKVADLTAGTTALAVQVLQFLTGKAPAQGTLALLLDNPASANDLTDVANLALTVENRYLKFAVEQMRSDAGGSFRAAYGALSFGDAVAKMYDAIIGNAKATAAGVNVAAAVAFVTGDLAYFKAYGGDDLGAKAAAAGFLMSKGLEAHIGLYNDATRAYVGKVFDGSAGYGASILPTGAPAEHAVDLMGAPAHAEAGLL